MRSRGQSTPGEGLDVGLGGLLVALRTWIDRACLPRIETFGPCISRDMSAGINADTHCLAGGGCASRRWIRPLGTGTPSIRWQVVAMCI